MKSNVKAPKRSKKNRPLSAMAERMQAIADDKGLAATVTEDDDGTVRLTTKGGTVIAVKPATKTKGSRQK